MYMKSSFMTVVQIEKKKKNGQVNVVAMVGKPSEQSEVGFLTYFLGQNKSQADEKR